MKMERTMMKIMNLMKMMYLQKRIERKRRIKTLMNHLIRIGSNVPYGIDATRFSELKEELIGMSVKTIKVRKRHVIFVNRFFPRFSRSLNTLF